MGLLRRAAVLGLFAAIFSVPDQRRPGFLVAAVILTFVSLSIAVFAPWDRLPRWVDAFPAYIYVIVVLCLREGTGGGRAAFAPLLLLPLFWLALYGTRSQLAIAFVLTTAVLAASNVIGDVTIYDVRFAVLAAAITPVVCFTINDLVRELADKREELEGLARTDQLTGLPNRREWERQLPLEMPGRVEPAPSCAS